MDVVVVCWDESDEGDDPLVSVYESKILADAWIRKLAGDSTFAGQVNEELENGADFYLNLSDDDDWDAHLRVWRFTLPVSLTEQVLTQGVL